MDSFVGKVAVVTGGASGVGRCLCDRLAEAGAKVVMADIAADRVEAEAAAIASARGTEVVGMVVDVTKSASLEALAEAVYDRFGACHLLFNNAGVGLGEASRTLWELPENDWRWGFDVNLFGVVNGIRAFVPRMIAGDEEGVIVNTSSGNGGLRSLPGTPIYAASKAAATSVSEVLHQQLAKREGGKLRAAILFPGPHVVNTAILASNKVRPAEYGDLKTAAYDKMEDLLKATGLEIQLTEPDEVARFALDGVRERRFWLLPESEKSDNEVMERARSIIGRGSPELVV